MTCERCGHRLEIGDYPFCPHGRSQHGIVTDESFIGGLTIENMAPEPVTVYSRAEFQKAMEQHGVEQRIKHVPGDQHLLNWADGIDAQTLDNARILLTRGSSPTADEPLLPSYRGEVRLLGRPAVSQRLR